MSKQQASPLKPAHVGELRAIVASTALLAAFAFHLLPWPGLVQWKVVALFFLMNLFMEVFVVRMPATKNAGTHSVGAVLYLAELMIVGPWFAGALACIGSIRPKDLSGQVKLRPFLFNRAHVLLSMSAGGLVFLALGGSVLPAHPMADFLPLVGAGLTNNFINLLVVNLYMARGLDRPVLATWASEASFAWASYLTDALMAFLMGVIYATTGFFGVVLYLVPLLFARWTLERFVRMRETFTDGIDALMEVLRLKDPETAAHSERVAQQALELGRRMRLRQRDLDALYYSGLLHDIGKVGVPDAVLGKNGPLTLKEYMMIKRHPAYSEQVTRHLSYLRGAVRGIGAHHERWDGAGYPLRRKDVHIPLSARMLAVVDTYDAITHSRSYREGSSAAAAFQELTGGAGTQFDATVVQHFVRLKRQHLEPDEQIRLQEAVQKALQRKREARAK